MLGSAFEAEDAVQETFVRAWRNYDRFEGRSALRSWLYRIATNVCLDMLGSSQRRARAMDLRPSATADTPLGPVLPDETWIEPIPDDRAVPAAGDPAEVAVARDTIRLAFIAALQHLPPRQRAVLILREVLRWHADEVAELLETSVASVNSALQRARATIASSRPSDTDRPDPMDEAQQALLARYIEAFERYDIERLTALLHEDAIQSMPPYDLWLAGRDEVFRWWFGPGIGCRGSRLVPTMANGSPAFGQWKPSGPGRQLRAVGAPGPGRLRREDRRDDVLPRHRADVPAVRTAARARLRRRLPAARRARPGRAGPTARARRRQPSGVGHASSRRGTAARVRPPSRGRDG
jgi:RNA polymerase sigma-70 factor (ECF subfamily)